jgi:FixJ family two-component response regulator
VPQGPLVAIVDDDVSIRDTTKDLIESAGFSAAAFTRAASLLKSRRLSQVTCLIADMRMPKMTGLELHQCRRRVVALGIMPRLNHLLVPC